MHLFDADRGEDSVIYGVVEEQHLCRLYDYGNQRQKFMRDYSLGCCAENCCEPFDSTSYYAESENREQHSDDADGKVVDQHLESAFNPSLDEIVEFLDGDSAERTHYHCSDEHRDICSGYDSDCCDCSRDATSVACDIFTGGVGYENRQKVVQCRGYYLCQMFVRQPSGRDEKCGDESPGNECPYVRHYHRAHRAPRSHQNILESHISRP